MAIVGAREWKRGLGCWIVAVSLWAVGSPVLAQDGTAQDGMVEEQARAHFNTGSVAFSGGRYADALEEFKKSYALSQRPKLLYNVGVAADRLRRDHEALEAFEQYLQQVPNAPERAEVEARIVVLRDAVARANNAQPTVAPVSPEPITEASEPLPVDTQASHPSAGQWIVLGGSGVVAVTGGVLLALALSDKSAVESPDDGVALNEIEDKRDGVPLLSTLGGTLLGVGLVGAAIATTWIVLSGDDDAPTVQAQVGLGSVSLRGRF